MLRSFGYPTAVAPQREIAPSPANRARSVAPLAASRAQAEGFLAGYREAIAAISSYPANADLAARLIDVFMLERALYELRYELENRPDWVGIPLAAVLEQIADGAP
jgi:maltose alpha-D-glucosyltransferase/alpha-amylase